jgi:Family of unknown function (DUF6387)
MSALTPPVPPWFRLENYEGLTSHSASDWHSEIANRVWTVHALSAPDSAFSPPEYAARARQDAREFFGRIKESPLTATCPESPPHPLVQMLRERDRSRRKALGIPECFDGAVADLSSRDAYRFLYYSERKSSIEEKLDAYEAANEILYPVDRTPLDVSKFIARDEEILEYSGPLWADPDWGAEQTEELYLAVRYMASDEQLVTDFKRWLMHIRSLGFTAASERPLSHRDFSRWIEMRILPYWDLVTIAAIDRTPLPNHVIGVALFPDEIEVDTTERVRKVVQPLAARVFRVDFERTLRLQLLQPE